MSATASERLAEYVHGLRFEDLPADVVAKAKDHIAYHFVHALLGHRVAEGTQAVAIARGLSEGAGDATIIGGGVRALPMDAAFANTTLMRAPGMDDVLFPLGVHAALVTLPGALALAERHGRSGRDLITAVVAGYDAIGTIGKGIQAWAARDARRPTIPFGPFGGAMSCARILGLGIAQIVNAIGYAAHSAMGLAVESGEWQHYYSLVTRNGMMAAILAQAGGLTSREILEARYGFFETFFGSAPQNFTATIADIGRKHEILSATTKRYPGTGANWCRSRTCARSCETSVSGPTTSRASMWCFRRCARSSRADTASRRTERDTRRARSTSRWRSSRSMAAGATSRDTSSRTHRRSPT